MKRRIGSINDMLEEGSAPRLHDKPNSAVAEVEDMISAPQNWKIHANDKKLLKEIKDQNLKMTVIDDGEDTCILMFRDPNDFMAKKEVYFIYHNSNYEPIEMMKITKVKIR